MNIDYPSLLNSSQLEAVSTSSKHVRVIAGAGSGKTRVLTYRIAYLIDVFHVNPSSILAVTFTNKAANEMKERVDKLIPGAAPFLTVATFHSWCARFLRREAYLLGFPPSFSILDDEDTGKLIQEIVVEHNYKKSDPIVKELRSYISRKKNVGLYPDDIKPSPFFINEKEFVEMYRDYERKKDNSLSMDFDDLLLKTLLILKNFPDVQQRWSNKYQHLLIDEFQDTNDVQYELLNLLSNESTNLYVVGDPDQTIYTWRGANQKIILDMPRRFLDLKDVILNENYRSTSSILNCANSLISHNKKRVPKDLFTNQSGGEPVTVRSFDKPEEEARYVVDEIEKIAGKGEDAIYSNIAILYRSSYLTRPFETELAHRGLPYRIFGGLRFYQRKEVKDVLAYFRVLVNEKDDVAFDRIINVPSRKIGPTSLEIIKKEAASLNLSEYEYVSNITNYPGTELSNRVLTSIVSLVAKMEDTKEKLKEKSEAYSGILKDFITDIGYYAYISEDQEVDEDRVGNVNALFDDLNSYLSHHPESTFEEYLQNIALISAQDDISGGNYISLMTVHVAKGLEFDNVFCIGMMDGSFPSSRALSDTTDRDAEEEERRLAYVAFTRAKKKLYVTYNTSYSYVNDGHQMPSRFIKEASLELPKQRYSDNWVYKKRNLDLDDNDYFNQGHGFDSFFSSKKEEKKIVEPKPTTNGVLHWNVGDIVNHEKFGRGKVVEIISPEIFVILFDNGNKKTMMSSHPMISKVVSNGGNA
ncbi:MAG TPA: ATP-dependent DNA helicase [Firmicutes bacterium]|nr:ATP-dependent DNA helicase [Bacillota bacterium]